MLFYVLLFKFYYTLNRYGIFLGGVSLSPDLGDFSLPVWRVAAS